MALGFPFGFRVANPEPLDNKYGPYATTAAAIAAVLAGERYIGLTVNVAGVEYWWKDATGDVDLVIKSMGGGWNTTGETILTGDVTISGNFSKFFTGTGNFAIGHNAPLAKLHVRGNGTTTGALTRMEDSAGTQRFLISDAGNLVIGTGALTNANTIFDIQSTTQGIAFPRMTAAQRDAIASPYDGLFVYNTTGKAPNWHDGVKWNDVKNRTVVTQNIAGAVSIDLSTGDMFILTLTANVTSFTFSNEIVGKEYIFVFLQDTTNKTIVWTAGKFAFPFGNAPALTNPTTNGTAPAKSKDIVTAICSVAGRLEIAYTPDLIDN